MNVLVTGANGYLGRGIVKALLDFGEKVTATDFSIDGIDERANRVEGDIFSLTDPYEYFGEPDVLLHLAWKDGFIHYSDAHIRELPKHYDFIRKFIDSNVKSIAVMGSMHEIGFYEGCIKDETPCNPITPYGISKNALRELLFMLAKKQNKNILWLRGYYIVGNYLNGASIFSKIAAAEAEGKEEFPFTTGQNQYDFLDYDEFCNQVASAVVQSEINGIINICSGKPEKLADRVERYIRTNNFSIKLKYGAFPDRPYDSKAVWGDNSKITRILDNRK